MAGAPRPDALSDGALVRRHLTGDEDAFAALYRRYVPRIAGMCERATGDHELAEDLAHDSLVKVLRSMDRFDPEKSMWPWLRVIAARVLIDHLRRVAAAPTVDDREPVVEPIDTLPCIEHRDALAAALARLPPRQRTALGLSYVRDWDARQAAAHLGLNRTAYDQLLMRARQGLRRQYRVSAK